MTEEKKLLRELTKILKRAEEIVSILGDDNPELPTMTDTQQEDYEVKIENDKIKVTKKGKIKTTKIGYFFDCKKIV